MTTKEIAEKNPFFTWEQFRQEAGVKETTGYARLQAAVKSNYVERLSKGIYVSHVGPWMEKPPSVFLLPAYLSDDAVLGFHSALDVFGHGHSQFFFVNYFSSKPGRKKINYGNYSVKGVATPVALVRRQATGFGVVERTIEGQRVKVTGRERTLVDCLDRLDLAGGPEEIIRSVGAFPYIKFDLLLEYLHLRNKPSLFSKTGFVLESYRELFNFSKGQEQQIKKGLTDAVTYIGPRRSGYRYISKWRLMVPQDANKWIEA